MWKSYIQRIGTRERELSGPSRVLGLNFWGHCDCPMGGLTQRHSLENENKERQVISWSV